MSSRAVAWILRSVVVLALLLLALGCLMLLANALGGRLPSGWLGYTLAFLSFLVVGLLIAARRPENPIGWMFCLIGLASAWDFFAQEYATFALVTHPGALPDGVWLAWSQIWTASITWALMFFSLLLFPTGRLLSRRWRPLAWTAAGTLILIVALTLIAPGPLPNPTLPGINPTGIEQAADIIESSRRILIPVILGVGLASATSVIVRFRRAQGAERQQLKWLAYAVGFLWGTGVGVSALNSRVLNNPLIEVFIGVLDIVGIAAVPTAIGIAILRYRLYEIDILINRTLVYGALTLSLVCVYLGSVISLQYAFRALTGEDSPLVIVASTLAIAALFNPLRRRIQSFIDRRFYRRKYDARKTLEAFGDRLRDEVDLEDLSNDVIGVVRDTLQPEHVSLWLRKPERKGAGSGP